MTFFSIAVLASTAQMPQEIAPTVASFRCETTYTRADTDLVNSVGLTINFHDNIKITKKGRLLFDGATFHFDGMEKVENYRLMMPPRLDGKPEIYSEDKNNTLMDIENIVYLPYVTEQDLKSPIATFYMKIIKKFPLNNVGNSTSASKKDWRAYCKQTSGF